MFFMRSFMAFAVMIGMVTPVNAGRLGQCVRCVANSGASFHLWTMQSGSLLYCEQRGLNSGGDGDPLLCDATAQVGRRGPQNDPFNRCTAGSPNHQVWIGGENNDLIVVGASLQAGTLYRLQDGEDLGCGSDVQSSRYITAVRYGERRDILDIFAVRRDQSIRRETFRIQDGRDQPFLVAGNYVARLVGVYRDIVVMYGFHDRSEIISHQVRIQDGRDHTIVPLSGSATDFGLVYGNHDDVRVRFCFSNGRWRQSAESRNGSFPDRC